MKIPLRKLVVILVTMATFSWVANLMASNPPDPRLEGLDLTPAQQAQVQRALLKVHERARERNQATCQRHRPPHRNEARHRLPRLRNEARHRLLPPKAARR